MKHKFKYYFIATRFPFITASVLPVFFCAAWMRHYHFAVQLPLVLLCAVGTVCVHLAANTLNDYYDWDHSDKDNLHASPFNGGSRRILGKVMLHRTFFFLAMIFLIGAAGILLLLFLRARYGLLPIAVIAVVLGLGYSMPPLKLQSRGLGELAIFVAFGPLLTLGTLYVLTGHMHVTFALIGVPMGLLTTSIIWLNEFPDIEADQRANKRTGVVRLGLRFSTYIFLGLQVAYYMSVVGLSWLGIFPWIAVVVAAFLPTTLSVVRQLFRVAHQPERIHKLQARTILFQVLNVAGLTLILFV